MLSTVRSQIVKNPSYGVVVTGHSLGGALATLAAIDISRLTSQTYLWTYGSPRVGNKNFYTLVQNAFRVSYRVVNNRDMVPHLPPRNYDFWHGMCHIQSNHQSNHQSSIQPSTPVNPPGTLAVR